MNSETIGNFKNFVGFDEAEIRRTSTEDLLSLRTVILNYLKKNSARKRSVSFREVYKRIMDELDRRKSASNSPRDNKKIPFPSFNEEQFNQEQIESSIDKLNNVYQPIYNKQESLLFNPKVFNHPTSIKKETKMINIHPIKTGKMKEVTSCSAVSLEFLGKKRPIPMQNDNNRDSSFGSMYEATRKFFEKNRSEISQERNCPSRSNSQVRIKQQATQITYISELEKHKLRMKKSMKKISQPLPFEGKDAYTYTSSSPQNHKNLDSWMSSTQSILPSIDLFEDSFFTENSSKLDNMMYSHRNNECKVALFDVPDEIPFELE
jgi:hypothetical protein